MPEPRENETRQEFIARCIPIVIADGTANDNVQAVAVCASMYEQAKGANVKREYKTFPIFESKVLDEDEGIVEHIVAVMGNTDLGGDVIHNGAFTKTVVERLGKIRVVDQHNTDSIMRVLGKPLQLYEIGRDMLPTALTKQYPEATGALVAKTQYLMSTPEGKGAFERIKAGAVDEYSIGYDAIQEDFSKATDGETVRNLREIRLWEYSPVIWGMNPATMTLGVKAVTPYQDFPLSERGYEWDATAADGRVRTWADAKTEPNDKYAMAFFWHDSEEPENYTSYKFPYVDIIDGEARAVFRAIANGAARLDGSDIPDADKERIRAQMGRYYAKAASEYDDDTIKPPWEKGITFVSNLTDDGSAILRVNDNGELYTKAGRAISKANEARIRKAAETAQGALDDLLTMLDDVLGVATAPDAEPGRDNEEAETDKAGPVDTPPTSENDAKEQDAAKLENERQELLTALKLMEVT